MDETKTGLFLRVVLMCILVLLCFWISGETWRLHDDSWLVDDFFLFFGPIVAGFIAGITSKAYRSVIIACLSTSVAVGLSASVFWAQDISSFPFGFFFLLVLMPIGVIPARAVRRLYGRIVERRTPPWRTAYWP